MVKERSQKKGKKGNSVGGTAPWSIKDEEARRRPKGDAATAAADAQVHTGGGQCLAKTANDGHGRPLARTLTAQVYPQWGLSRPHCAVRVGGGGEKGG